MQELNIKKIALENEWLQIEVERNRRRVSIV
jgi:hypothetical protein